jgi:phosphoribosylformimino-5-aminoimidazole carboxamide ribotide isomerase
MILYPAIDLMDGKCVRLEQGRRERCTVYSEQPEKMAIRWAACGAKWLHVIDLDAAIDQNCFANRAAVRAILSAIDIPVQLGGGIRTADHIKQYLDDGVARLIVGTSVLESRDFARGIFSGFGECVAVSIDSANGKVAVKGWTDYTDIGTVEAALRMREDGAKRIILTDIKRDGMLSEPNFEMMAEVADATGVQVIAAGGVTLVEHVARLATLGRPNIEGAIIGKALYTGDFDLKAAIKEFPQ